MTDTQETPVAALDAAPPLEPAALKAPLEDASPEPSEIAAAVMARIATADDEDAYRELRDQLWTLGEPAIPVMRAALTSPSVRQRCAAACNLGRMGDVPSLNPLIQLLRDPSGKVREMAIFGLGVMGRKEAIRPVLNAFNDYDADVRYRVLIALRDLGYDQIETVLIRAMLDDAYGVREQALSTLRDVATPAALPAMALALLDAEPKMQSMAEVTLDRVLPQARPNHLSLLNDHLSPRQARLLMNYLEGRNLHEVWSPLHAHLASMIRRPTQARSLLDKYGRILNDEHHRDELGHAFLRDEPVELLLDLFTSPHHTKSVLLVGPAGSGKTAVVHEFARRLHERRPELLVLETNTSELMTGTRYLGEWETKLKEMTDAIRAHGHVILYVTNPNELVGAGAHSKSNESFADFFKPYLQRGEVRVLGETTEESLKGGLTRDPGLLRLFEQVRLEPMNDIESRSVLHLLLPTLAERDERPLEASAETLADVVDYARSFLTRQGLPGAACDLLETVIEYKARVTHAGPRGEVVLEGRDVPRALSRLTQIDLALVDDEVPLDLEAWRAWFQSRMVEQEHVIQATLERLALIKTGMRDPQRPMSTLFLVGPTGVGKTWFAKLLAERLFGDPKRMIRFDLSEYQGRMAVEKLIGSPHDKDREGLLTEAILNQPYCVLLLDEFEKADPEVYHLFLQVLDEGRLTDARGRTADFRQAIILMTSNLGASRISVSPLGFGPGDAHGLSGHIRRRMEEVFQPEFINRLDDVLVFQPLDRPAIRRLVDLEVERLSERRGLRRHGLALELSPEASDWIAQEGFSPRFGARELKRHLERHVLTRASEALLRAGRPTPGTVIRVEREGEGLEVKLIPPA